MVADQFVHPNGITFTLKARPHVCKILSPFGLNMKNPLTLTPVWLDQWIVPQDQSDPSARGVVSHVERASNSVILKQN